MCPPSRVTQRGVSRSRSAFQDEDLAIDAFTPALARAGQGLESTLGCCGDRLCAGRDTYREERELCVTRSFKDGLSGGVSKVGCSQKWL
jgi:hypothetical protein